MFPKLYHPKFPPKFSLPNHLNNFSTNDINNCDQDANTNMSNKNQIKFVDLLKIDMNTQQLNNG